MNAYLRLIGTLALMALLSATEVFAQAGDEPTAGETPADGAAAAADQEVEINEDNYRQFMELRDVRQQRNALPENMFKPQSGLQKMDDLPEASQKHLRNQLREIIVQGDEWQPGDEGNVFPYVPSEAANGDPALQEQEAEAWGELVDSYHKREAEIYENAARTEAAMASMDAAGGSQGDGQQSSGDKSGQGGRAMENQPGERDRSGQGGAADSFSPGAMDPDARSTAGVSQNAMEFIQQQMNQAGGSGRGNSDTPPDNPGSAVAQAGTEQQRGGEQDSAEVNPTANAVAGNSDRSESKDADGVSQNAMEFLSGNSNQVTAASGSGAGAPAEGAGAGSAPGESQAQEGEPGGTEQERRVSDALASTASEAVSQAENGSSEGVSQNAKEFLSASTDQSNGAMDSGDGSSSENDGQDDAGVEGQQQAGETTTEQQDNAAGAAVANTPEGASATTVNAGTMGTSQNALEYLMGGNSGSSQGQGDGPGGTLSIQDLMNARGTRAPGGAGSPPPDTDEDDAPVGKIPDKDGG